MAMQLGHNLVAVLNDPEHPEGPDLGLDGLFASAPRFTQLSPVLLSDFDEVIQNVSEPYDRLLVARHLHVRHNVSLDSSGIVPDIFMTSNFDLRSSATWAAAVGDNPGSALTQERLSASLDIVEARLAKGIAERANEFFAAVVALQDLHTEVSQTLALVRTIRGNVRRAVDPKASLRIYAMMRRRANIRAVLDVTRMIAAARQAQPTVQLLLRQRDFAGALDLIARTTAVVRQHGALAGVAALRHTASQLTEVAGIIARVIAEDLAMSAASAELVDIILLINSNMYKPDPHRLQPIFAGLLRTSKLADSLEQYRTSIAEAMRSMLKEVVIQ